MTKSHTGRGKTHAAAVIMLTGALTLTMGVAGLVAPAAQAKHGGAAHKKKHRKRKAKVVSAPARAAMPAACQATAPDPGVINGTLDPLIQHIDSAHLETSPGAQVNAIVLTPDQYVQLHTTLVEMMLAPALDSVAKLSGVLQGVLAPLVEHIDSAHLETSPFDQVNALLSDPDGYALLHTILAEHATQPLIDWVTSLLGAAGISCGAPAPAPGAGSAAMAPMAPAAAATPMAVKIASFAFAPGAATVPVGTTVTWTNHDAVAHTVTSTAGGPLKSANIGPEKTYSYTFSAPGTYTYVCAIHPNMKGAITVQ